jgi:hypothetical protein
MKKHLRVVLAGLVLFMWQFISHAVADFHGSATSYTPQQDSILAILEKSGLEERGYMIPRTAGNAGEAERNAFSAERVGKPWAMVTYHKSWNSSITLPLIRSLLTDMVIMWLLIYILDAISSITMLRSISLATGVGLISFLAFPYTDNIWFQTPDVWASLADGIVPWTFVGALYYRFWRP